MSNATAAKVKAVNRANATAIKLYEQLVPIFTPLVGQQVLKQGGELLAKVEKILPKLPNTPSLSVFRQVSRYSLGWTVKTCEQIQGESCCLYYETTVVIGELSNGVLTAISSPYTARTDWTLEEVLEKREAFRKADRARDEARSALHPFGERYDN